MALTINGVTARSLGYVVEDPDGFRDAGDRSWPLVTIPGRQGSTRLDPTAVEAPVPLTIRGIIDGTSALDARTKLDVLLAKCSTDPVKLVFDDLPTRERRCQLAGVKVETAGRPVIIDRRLRVTLRFAAHDPYTYDTTDQTVSGIGNADVAIPLGNAASRPVLTITGAATNPTITYKNSALATLQTMSFTTSLLAGETLVVDLDAMTVKRIGVLNLALLTSGDFFDLDAVTDGDYASSAWPKLRCSSGTMVAVYRRAWKT